MHSFVLRRLLDSAREKAKRIVIRSAWSRDLWEYAGASPGPNHRATDPNPPMFVDRRTHRLLFAEKVSFMPVGGLRGRYLPSGSRK